jgi:hypothetical protein
MPSIWGPTLPLCVFPQRVAEYLDLLYQYYTEGGFTDELGQWHDGYKFNFPWFEILNEVVRPAMPHDAGHTISPHPHPPSKITWVHGRYLSSRR